MRSEETIYLETILGATRAAEEFVLSDFPGTILDAAGASGKRVRGCDS